MEATELQYQTQICVAGTWFMCVESYESLFARLRETNMKVQDAKGHPVQMDWFEPLELTVRGAVGETGEALPLRAAISPLAVSALLEIPQTDRTNVETNG